MQNELYEASGSISLFLRIADHLHFSKFVNLQNVRCLNEGVRQHVKAHCMNAYALN